MAHVKVSLYQSIKVAGKWVLRRAPEQRLRHLSEDGYYVRFGNRMEPAGRDRGMALAALKRKQAELNFVAVGGSFEPPTNWGCELWRKGGSLIQYPLGPMVLPLSALPIAGVLAFTSV